MNSFVKTISDAGYPTSNFYVLHGDFNGDGKHDILSRYRNASAHWVMFMSKGNDYTWPADTIPIDKTCEYNNSNYPPKYPPMILDVNGDGKDDIIQTIFNYNLQKLSVNVYYSEGYVDGHYKFRHSVFQNDNIFNFNTNNANFWRYGDFNGDGKTDMLYTQVAPNANHIIVYFYKDEQYELVKTITDGFGKKILLDYAFLSSPRIRYYGDYAKKAAYPLVKEMKQSNGIGNNYFSTTFYYSNAQFDFGRRLLLGFERFRVNYDKEISKQYHFVKNGTFRHLMLQQMVVFEDNNPMKDGGVVCADSLDESANANFYFEEIYNTITYKNLGNNRFLPYYSINSNINRLKNTNRRTCIALQEDGRISEQEVSNERHLGDMANRLTTQYSYINVNLPNGFSVKKMASISATSAMVGSSQTPTQTFTYTYNQSGQPYTIVESNVDATTTQTFNSYNNLGLPLSKTISTQGLLSRTEIFSYDNTGRFISQYINDLNQVSSQTFDEKTGNILSFTDVNNLITTYNYDHFGRNIAIIHPDQTKDSISYHWNTASAPANAVFIQKRQLQGGHTS